MPTLMISPYLFPILLLIGSNAFMTTAWYWYLRYKDVPLWQVILISWGLAFFEYCLSVPANRYGNAVYRAIKTPSSRSKYALIEFCSWRPHPFSVAMDSADKKCRHSSAAAKVSLAIAIGFARELAAR